MSEKCPKCESRDIHITYYSAPTDNMATCYGCGYTDLAERFPDQSVFDRITASEERLAIEFVFATSSIINGRSSTVWCSCLDDLCGRVFFSQHEAIAATVNKLKEVAE